MTRTGIGKHHVMDELIARHRQEILRIAADNGASNLRLFGSLARGEATSSSDVDILADLDEGRSYFDLFELQYALEALLGRPVDVRTEPEVRRIMDRIAKDIVPI